MARVGRLRAFVPSGVTLAAVLTWLVVLPLGFLGVRQLDLNPLTTQGVAAPVAYALFAGTALVGLSLVIHAEWLTGVAAGVFAAWCGITVAANLVGTPFGYGAMTGDAGRMSALATYFSTTWDPSDAADPNLPPEYPPLYPMLLGRVAALTGRQAWSLLGTSQALLIAASVLVAFTLWRRMVPSHIALALSGTVFIGLSEPSKANEVFALSLFLPLLLATFAPPRDIRPLNPVLAGLLFGLMVPLYPNFLMFGLLGIALMFFVGWRAADRTRAYVVHAAITVGIAVLLSSWYLGPLIVGYSQGPTQVVADLFKSAALADEQLQLLGTAVQPQLLGTGSVLLFALQVIGVAGIVTLWRRAWWAQPVGVLLAGVLIAKTLMLLRFVVTSHSLMLLYVPYLLRFAAAAAGVLTLWQLWQVKGSGLLERIGAPRRLAGVMTVAALVGVIAQATWAVWLPAPAGLRDVNGARTSTQKITNATRAHMEFLPNGARPQFPAITMTPGLPAAKIYQLIDIDLGKEADPVVLTTDQRVFSFRAFRNYLPPSRESSNALTRWDDRKAVVDTIAAITNPDQMNSALGDTAFGPVNVLVLQARSGRWIWRDVSFSRVAFDGPHFSVHSNLPGGYVLITRRG